MSKKLGLALLALLVLTPAAARAEYTVRGKGRLIAKEGTTELPVPRARVQLMDQDSDFDEVMAVGTTDASGAFDLTGKADDSFTLCDGCDYPDPYIKFILIDEGRVDVHNIWGSTHFGLSAVHEDQKGTIDWGKTQFEHDEMLYPRLFRHVQVQYAKFTELTGDALVPGGTVGVTVPEVLEFGVPWTGVENIHWPGDFKSVENTRKVFHEFGHRIRHRADGDLGHFIGDTMLFRYARSHSMKEHSNVGFAFNEGWAEYHATLLDPEARDRLVNWTILEPGAEEDEIEGNVAKKIFDLSIRCGGFKAIWAALKSGTGKSIDGGPAGAQTGVHSYKQLESLVLKGGTCQPKLTIPPSVMPRIPLPSASPTVALNDQSAAVAKLLASLDARASKPAKPKWTAARLAKLPAALQGPVKRIADKREAHAKTHETAMRAALRGFTQSVKPATTQTASDGTYERSVAAARVNLLKTTGEPRMRQIAEIKADLARERAATTDRRLQAYIDRLVRRYGEQENEIRRALANPAAPLPDALVPRSFGHAVVAAP